MSGSPGESKVAQAAGPHVGPGDPEKRRNRCFTTDGLAGSLQNHSHFCRRTSPLSAEVGLGQSNCSLILHLIPPPPPPRHSRKPTRCGKAEMRGGGHGVVWDPVATAEAAGSGAGRTVTSCGLKGQPLPEWAHTERRRARRPAFLCVCTGESGKWGEFHAPFRGICRG